MFDALLIGHEDWVHSCSWEQAQFHGIIKHNFSVSNCSNHLQDGVYHQPLSLISASADKSIMVWKPDFESSIWTIFSRLGEVGGTGFGFYGALFGYKSQYILAHGYNGAIQLWDNSSNGELLNFNENCSLYLQNILDEWSPRLGVSGHFKSVKDLAWNPSGQYLVSVSLDQTARLWGKWNRDSKSSWHELSRPQVHGYDLHCIAFFDQYGYSSGADEKVPSPSSS